MDYGKSQKKSFKGVVKMLEYYLIYAVSIGIACFFSWKGGFKNGLNDGVNFALWNLEKSGVITVTEENGEEVIRPVQDKNVQIRTE